MLNTMFPLTEINLLHNVLVWSDERAIGKDCMKCVCSEIFLIPTYNYIFDSQEMIIVLLEALVVMEHVLDIFIYDLFNETVGNSDYRALNEKMFCE
jgi:hypothetical protein